MKKLLLGLTLITSMGAFASIGEVKSNFCSLTEEIKTSHGVSFSDELEQRAQNVCEMISYEMDSEDAKELGQVALAMSDELEGINNDKNMALSSAEWELIGVSQDAAAEAIYLNLPNF